MKKCILAIFLALSMLFSGCNKQINNSKNESQKSVQVPSKSDDSYIDNYKNNTSKLKILVNNKFLYDCVKDIDKGRHDVDYLFDYSNQEVMIRYYYDIKYVPDLFIYDDYNFKNLNSKYLDKINGYKVGIINASRGVNQLSYYKNIFKYGKDNENLFWNNIDNYKVVLVNVKNAIIERDPKNRSFYEKNFNELLKKLTPYQKYFKEQSNKLKNYDFIIEGNSLDYMMAYMGLKTISIGENDENTINLSNIIAQKYNGDSSQKILLYYNDSYILKYHDDILKYNIKCIKIKKIDPNLEYQNLLQYEKEVIDSVVNICTKS